MPNNLHLALNVNGEPTEVAFAPHKTLLEVLREDLNLVRHQARLRARRMRRVRGAARRAAGALVPGARRGVRRPRRAHRRRPGDRRPPASAAGDLRRPRRARSAATARRDSWSPRRRCSTSTPARRATRSARRSPAASAAAPAISRSSRRSKPRCAIRCKPRPKPQSAVAEAEAR